MEDTAAAANSKMQSSISVSSSISRHHNHGNDNGIESGRETNPLMMNDNTMSGKNTPVIVVVFLSLVVT